MNTLMHNSKHSASIYLSKFKWTKLQTFILAHIHEHGSIIDNLGDIYTTFNPKGLSLSSYGFSDTKEKTRIGLMRPSRLPSNWRKKDIRFFIY